MKKHESSLLVLSDQEKNRAPMVEIFGGVFALLMILFVLLNALSQASIQERLESTSDEGLHKIGWGASGAGYVTIAFPNELRIIETGERAIKNSICEANGPFVKYARKIYRQKNQQIIFALLEGSVPILAEARQCLIDLMPKQRITVGWIIANNELLKSVSLDDIPSYIRDIIP